MEVPLKANARERAVKRMNEDERWKSELVKKNERHSGANESPFPPPCAIRTSAARARGVHQSENARDVRAHSGV